MSPSKIFQAKGYRNNLFKKAELDIRVQNAFIRVDFFHIRVLETRENSCVQEQEKGPFTEKSMEKGLRANSGYPCPLGQDSRPEGQARMYFSSNFMVWQN